MTRPTMTTRINFHSCPKRFCGERVPNSIFACYKHWTFLSKEIQQAIGRTAGLPVLNPSRRWAILMARRYWGDTTD